MSHVPNRGGRNRGQATSFGKPGTGNRGQATSFFGHVLRRRRPCCPPLKRWATFSRPYGTAPLDVWSPVGTIEHSPPIHWWESGRLKMLANRTPARKTDVHWGGGGRHSSPPLKRWATLSRPYGTAPLEVWSPVGTTEGSPPIHWWESGRC